MSDKKARVPQIRFAGFAGDWEERKLGDLLSETKRPIKMEDSKVYQLVTVKRRNEGIISRGFYKGKDILVKNYFELKAGDYLISKRQVVHGANGIVPKNLDGAIVSNEYLVSVENENITADFLTILSKLPLMYKMFFLSSYGIDIEKLVFNVEDWKKRKISLPSLTEQIQISNFFNELDNLITLQQRQLDKLDSVKKTMLEKMFPKDGANVPEIRFAGFTGAWEERKVKDLFKVTRGNVLAATITSEKKTEDAPYPVYSSQTKQNGLMGYYKEFLYEDAITWTTDGANAGTVNYRAGKFYCTNVCGVLLTNEIKANQMIAEALNNIAKKYVSYVGNPKLMNNVMADIELILPRQEKERDIIASFFCDLDTLLTLHQRELNALKTLKKSMLQQLFV